jgi:hypothetical protein
MKIVETFDPNSNFWEEHAQLAATGPIKDLYNKDKSRNKAVSSKLMWCIALIWDSNSKFYNLPEEGEDSKIDLIFEDYYGSTKYFKDNKKKIYELRDFYLKLQESPARRALREIEDKLAERARFLKSTPYDLGVCNERGQWIGNTATILDKMMADTKKIYDLYNEALKTVAAEAVSEERVKGGGNLSLSDKEEI